MKLSKAFQDGCTLPAEKLKSMTRVFCDNLAHRHGQARRDGAAAGPDWTCWPGAGSICPPISAARPRTCTAGWPWNWRR